MLPIVLGGLALLTVAAYKKAKKAKQASDYGVLTPNRKYIFVRALDGKLTPQQYKDFADAYTTVGLPNEADLLRKRASLGEMSAEQKAKLQDLSQKALASSKPDGIKAVADYMLSIGAVGTAANLLNHAKATASANAIKATAPQVVAVTPETSVTPEVTPEATPTPAPEPVPVQPAT